MRKRDTDDLSEEELRQLLIDKRRDARRERLDAFERSGRVVRLVSDSQPDGTHFPTLQAGSEILPAVGRSNPDRRKPGRTVFDRILLLVEILAIAGLVYVVASGAVRFRDLNQQMSNELEQPTPTLLVLPAVVLPDGHTPPVSGGQAQPNEAEIPEVLRPTQAALAVLPTPTESPQQATRIQIPALQVDAPVVQGDSWDQLKKGVAQHRGTPDPGQKGNLVLSGHNDVFGEVFRELDRLKPGDQVILMTSTHQYKYTVTGTQIVAPTDVSVMAPTETPTVTLISCYPFLVDTQRIVVTAELKAN